MTEQTIFVAALDIPDPARRSAYVESACAGDATLRRQVEALLAAHNRSGLFLDEPAVEQLAGGRNAVTVGVDVPAGPDTPTLTSPDSAPAGGIDLAFLTPPTRPGALGRLAHYEVLEVLGRGGFGTVLRAFDKRLHRVVAIKVLSPQLATSGSARARFNREAKAGAAIRDEHVVSIHAVSDDTEPVPYLVMECISGQTLQQKLDRTGPLSIPEVLRIGSQIAKGLAAAHATGLIHRDVKPSNILLENGVERVKLTDFGLARAADDASISHSGVVAGTPSYMAPEQAHGGKIDHRADLFSLGSVLYAMCTGHPPFRATTTMAVLKRVCEDEPRPVREVNPEVPEWLTTVVARLHAKKPEDRFQSAREVADLLAKYQGELQAAGVVTPVEAGREERREPPTVTRIGSITRRRSPWRAAVAGTLTAVALGVTLVLLWPSGHGTVRLELDDPKLEATLSGSNLVFKGGEPHAQTVAAGDHRLTVRRGDLEFDTESFPVRRGETTVVTIVVRNGKVQAMHGARLLGEKALAGRPPVIDGWVQLFNSLDLTGWKVLPKDKGEWRVTADGTLVGTGGMTHLLTARGDYENFHLRVQMRLGDRGTGVSFRCQEQMYFFGLYPLGYRAWLAPTKDVSSLLYVYPGEDLLRESKAVQVKEDTWVTLEVIARGSRLITLLDGQKTADVANTDVRRGHIALSADDVAFRSVEIKELPPPSPEEDGWQSLFNGADLSGWTAVPNESGPWSVRDGVLRGSAVKSVLFARRREYGDFHLKAVARINDGGDGGLLFRGDEAKLEKGQPHGYEAQINATLQNVPRTGSLEDTLANHQVGKDPQVKPGEWFTYEVIAQGYRIQLKVNGQTTLEWMDRNQQRARGHLGLQVAGDKTVVEFKSIEVKELTGPATLDGRWLVESIEQQGKPVSEADGRFLPREMIIGGNRWGVVQANGTRREGGLRIHTDRVPPQIEVTHSIFAKNQAAGLMIYRLDGDRLTICAGGAEAPISFTTDPSSTNVLMVLRRAGPADTAIPLRAFTPGKDPLPLPHRGPAKAVTVVDDAWRIENATDPPGNFNVMVAQELRDLPKDGVLVFRAKVKVEGNAKDKAHSWGDLGFGGANQVYPVWDQWPAARSRYDGNDTQWVEKEARYPATEMHKKGPTVYLCAGLHDKGVLWLKDVELLHIPAENAGSPKQ